MDFLTFMTVVLLGGVAGPVFDFFAAILAALGTLIGGAA